MPVRITVPPFALKLPEFVQLPVMFISALKGAVRDLVSLIATLLKVFVLEPKIWVLPLKITVFVPASKPAVPALLVQFPEIVIFWSLESRVPALMIRFPVKVSGSPSCNVAMPDFVRLHKLAPPETKVCFDVPSKVTVPALALNIPLLEPIQLP